MRRCTHTQVAIAARSLVAKKMLAQDLHVHVCPAESAQGHEPPGAGIRANALYAARATLRCDGDAPLEVGW